VPPIPSPFNTDNTTELVLEPLEVWIMYSLDAQSNLGLMLFSPRRAKRIEIIPLARTNAGWHAMTTAPLGGNSITSWVALSGWPHGSQNLYIIASSIILSGSIGNPVKTTCRVVLVLSEKESVSDSTVSIAPLNYMFLKDPKRN
jgi:hypothetical protein